MQNNNNSQLDAFQELVALKYQIYNSLFLTLPFKNLTKIGIDLPVFAEFCAIGLKEGKSPKTIVTEFFQKILPAEDFALKVDYLVLMLQFVERQVVLLDALEDAAFAKTHNLYEEGTFKAFCDKITSSNKVTEARAILKNYQTRLVLTAHPTQFYPAEILAIISQLVPAVTKNELHDISLILLQLGLTRFKNSDQPTPLDEANIIIRYMEKIFYPVITNFQCELNKMFGANISDKDQLPSLLELGFWPGGDRDGNPYVTAQITEQVAKDLKSSIIHLYISEIKQLKQHLTFKDLWRTLDDIIVNLAAILNTATSRYNIASQLINDLIELKEIIIKNFSGLFVAKLDKLITAIQVFGFYFASIDVRQNSKVHAVAMQNIAVGYNILDAEQKVNYLIQGINKPSKIKKINQDHQIAEILTTFKVIKDIQKNNGEIGLHRYIISNTQAAYQILEVIFFAINAGWKFTELTLDVVPLFETISDLAHAKKIMQQLYELPLYRQHLKNRQNKQYIMLGFSDSTKDGGYITANWSIAKCKQELAQLAEQYAITVIFFDGRGGSPTRGGDSTHKYYRAMEGLIKQNQIETTIQGQTISTDFGTETTAKYHIEHLFTQALSAKLFPKKMAQIDADDSALIEAISKISFEQYQKLRKDPLFLEYLAQVTPVAYYGALNIASRPVQRSKHKQLNFSDLRAIPYVGSWSQIKQNIPGFYGLGTALNELIKSGRRSALQKLYQHSLYFQILLDNVMQVLIKSNYLLTSYLRKDKKFGVFWQKLYDEYQLTLKTIKEITQQKIILEHEVITRESIALREQIVLPLLVIQQYAMMELAEMNANPKLKNTKRYRTLQKIIIKALAPNINASRNSA